MLTSCSVCWTVPGVLIFDHRLWDLLLIQFLELILQQAHVFFPFGGKYTLQDEVSLIFSLFCLTVHLSKCTRGLLHKPPVFEICFGPPCPGFNTVCKVFLSGVSLEALFTQARHFPSQQEIPVLLSLFLGIFALFKWPFLTQVFPQCLLGEFPCPGLSWFKSNPEYSLPHLRWTYLRHIVLISFVLRIYMDFGIVKLVRYC